MRFEFISAPNWFFTPDFLINVFSFLILLTFLILCIRNYKLNKSKGMLFLGWGFAFIAIAQLALLATKFGLYYNTSFKTYIGNIIIQYNIVSSSNAVYQLGIFFNKALTLAGLYIISRLSKRNKSLKDIFLIGYFVFLSILTSDVVTDLFHLTVMGLFAYLCYNYYKLYRKNKFPNTLILSVAFGILALSHALLLLEQINFFNVTADILELGSYAILLALIIKILKHGNEKKPDGHNIRHAEHHPRKRRKH